MLHSVEGSVVTVRVAPCKTVTSAAAEALVLVPQLFATVVAVRVALKSVHTPDAGWLQFTVSVRAAWGQKERWFTSRRGLLELSAHE